MVSTQRARRVHHTKCLRLRAELRAKKLVAAKLCRATVDKQDFRHRACGHVEHLLLADNASTTWVQVLALPGEEGMTLVQRAGSIVVP